MAKGKLMLLPKGPAVFPALHRPDTKFDELGIWKADISVDAEEAKDIIAALQKIAKAHMGKAMQKTSNSCWYLETDDEGEETGRVVFKCRVKNRLRKDGKLWDRRPMVIDAKKNEMPTDVAVWGGSVLRVQVEVYEWVAGAKKGVSLQPTVVQVIQLVTGSGPNLKDFDEEDGYEIDDAADNTTDTDTAPFSDESGVDDNEDY